MHAPLTWLRCYKISRSNNYCKSLRAPVEFSSPPWSLRRDVRDSIQKYKIHRSRHEFASYKKSACLTRLNDSSNGAADGTPTAESPCTIAANALTCRYVWHPHDS